MLKKLKFNLKTPVNLSYWWNLGSLLGILISIQIITGILLTIYYENSYYAFYSVWKLHININNGYLLHYFHLNCSSFIFLMLYFHVFKGLIFSSFLNHKVLWVSGFIIMMLMMMISFMGYVLPWGQMSLWGATVITNLVSVIPFLGDDLVKWIWGGFFVSNYTLKLFFSFHFLLPLIMSVIIIFHIIILHLNGSSNPLGGFLNYKTEFLPLYLYKDLMNFIILLILSMMIMMKPYFLSDPENFIHSNSLVSPIHIQPEWYFLSYYCILRAIPNKLGGVIMFLLSIMMILMLIYFKSKFNYQSFKIWWFYCSLFFVLNLMLIWMGSCPVISPYILMSLIMTMGYFIWFLILFIINE